MAFLDKFRLPIDRAQSACLPARLHAIGGGYVTITAHSCVTYGHRLCATCLLRYHDANTGQKDPKAEQMQISKAQQLRLRPRLGGMMTLVCILTLSGCVTPETSQMARSTADASAIGPLETPAVVDSSVGTCFARDTTPAVIETVTEQVIVQPASVRSDGSVETPAAFRTVTRQRILRERREVEFETPCNDVLTPQFVASVQRALLARGYYRGPINGRIDANTSNAIKRFQTAQDDVQTGILTLQSARILGLVAQPRDAD